MKKSNIFYGWWIVLGSSILLAVLGPGSVALANLFQTPVAQEFGISNSQFTISNSLVLGVGVFLAPFISQKLATSNFKLIYSIGILIYSFAFMGFGFAPNIYVFYLLSLFVGLGFMMTNTIPVNILINNWFVKKRGLALSLAISGLGVGGMVFSYILTPLIINVGWRQTYVIYGAIMLVVSLPIVLFVFKLKPELMNLKAYGTENLEIVETTTKPEQPQGVQPSKSKLGMTPYFSLLMIGTILVGIVNNGGFGQFPPVLYSLHGPATGAMIISIYSVVGIVGKISYGHIHDRFGTVVSVLYSSTLLTLTYLLMIFGDNLAFAVVMAVFFGLSNAMGSLTPPLITASIYSAEDFPKVNGYVQSALHLGMTVGSLIAASIADYTGSYTASWIVLAVAAILVAIAWIGAYRNAQKSNRSL